MNVSAQYGVFYDSFYCKKGLKWRDLKRKRGILTIIHFERDIAQIKICGEKINDMKKTSEGSHSRYCNHFTSTTSILKAQSYN